MDPKVTKEYLLLFIYNELKAAEVKAIKNELKCNIDLRLEYDELVRTVKDLDLLWDSPNPTTLKIIDEKAHDGFSEMV
ncbi:hypothetical protein N9J24_01985 [Bacteroidia bacterium]|nr:hypothetical protein [Bacteroidia bacterium]